MREICQVTLRQGQEDGIAWQPAPDPPIGVLDRWLLPGRLRIAEPGLRAEAAFKLAPGYELRAAIEGQALAGMLGQGRQQAYQTVHDRL